MTADPEHHAVVFGRGPNDDFVWNLDGERRTMKRGKKLPGYNEVFAVFYPDFSLKDRRLVGMLHG